jgi:MiaB-like tRNA modifying enzyme
LNDLQVDEVLRKSKRVYVQSFGCPTNFADGEVIAGCLSESGYNVVSRVEDADILVYNTCAVKTPTENRMIKILKKAPNSKKVVVTGCLPLINFDRLKREVGFDGVVGPSPGAKIVEAIRKVERGEKVIDLCRGMKPSYSLPRIRRNRVVAILPISYGCLGLCSYCCVRFARGKLRSFTVDEIKRRMKEDLRAGAKEVWLTSQDTGYYGRDIGTNLISLLKEVVEVEGKFYVRVGMMNPNYAVKMLDDLIDVYKNERVYKFLHVPVQSGDDAVLKRMNRYYSLEDFKEVVSSFRNEIPNITISTDMICGFPGESEEAFRNSIDLVREVRPDILNISRFFPRPGTPALGMRQLPGWKIKERSRIMSELFREMRLEKNRPWLHWRGEILIDEKGKNGSWIGRNFAYKPIVIKSGKSLLGEFLTVQVKSVHPTYLYAETV